MWVGLERCRSDVIEGGLEWCRGYVKTVLE